VIGLGKKEQDGKQVRIDFSQSAVSQVNVQAGKLCNEMVSESNTQPNNAMNNLRDVREFGTGLENYRKRHRITDPAKDARSPWFAVRRLLPLARLDQAGAIIPLAD
jgi:hypothetical protein